MVLLAIFCVLQALVSAHAIRFGGLPERIAAVLLAGALAASALIPLTIHSFGHFELSLFTIDVLLLAGLVALSLFADRYWPMWLAALQLLAVSVHLARLLDPAIVPQVYWAIGGSVGWPIVLLQLAGSVRHRTRKAAGMPELDWTPRSAADDVSSGSWTDPR